MNEKERKRARWERQWRQTRCISSFWWIFSPHVWPHSTSVISSSSSRFLRQWRRSTRTIYSYYYDRRVLFVNRQLSGRHISTDAFFRFLVSRACCLPPLFFVKVNCRAPEASYIDKIFSIFLVCTKAFQPRSRCAHLQIHVFLFSLSLFDIHFISTLFCECTQVTCITSYLVRRFLGYDSVTSLSIFLLQIEPFTIDRNHE